MATFDPEQTLDHTECPAYTCCFSRTLSLRRTSTWLGLICLLVLLLGAPVVRAECRFAYTDAIRRGIIDPEVSHRKSSAYVFSDENPAVVVTGDNIELLLSPEAPPNGGASLDPPEFDILLGKCGKVLLGSRLWWSPGTGVISPWIAPTQDWPPGEWSRDYRTWHPK
jgi:hypothetical protein